jgi:hypothetical protein
MSLVLIYSPGLKWWNIHLNSRVFHMIREKQKSYKLLVKGFVVSILMFEFLLHQRFSVWWWKYVELSLRKTDSCANRGNPWLNLSQIRTFASQVPNTINSTCTGFGYNNLESDYKFMSAAVQIEMSSRKLRWQWWQRKYICNWFLMVSLIQNLTVLFWLGVSMPRAMDIEAILVRDRLLHDQKMGVRCTVTATHIEWRWSWCTVYEYWLKPLFNIPLYLFILPPDLKWIYFNYKWCEMLKPRIVVSCTCNTRFLSSSVPVNAFKLIRRRQ